MLADLFQWLIGKPVAGACGYERLLNFGTDVAWGHCDLEEYASQVFSQTWEVDGVKHSLLHGEAARLKLWAHGK